MAKTKVVRIPETLAERLAARAKEEQRTIPEVLSDLIDLLPKSDDAATPKECVFCGQPTTVGRICDECFYDPEIVRPQKFGAFYYHFKMAIVPDTPMKGTFDEFIAWLSKEIATTFYGATEQEWEVWQEWLKWRKAFSNGEANINDPDWRRFCVYAYKDGYVGERQGWTVTLALFGSLGKKVTQNAPPAEEND